MTADFYPFDMPFLGATATRIINEVKGVNRVVYDITSKPPGTIEWECGAMPNIAILVGNTEYGSLANLDCCRAGCGLSGERG
jgi:hypothetical protein